MKIEKEPTPLAVKLSFDLTTYLKLRTQLHVSMQKLENLEQKRRSEFFPEKKIAFIREKINGLKSEIRLEQIKLNVDKLSARFKWQEITDLFAESCNRENPLENELADRLQEKLDAPLALICMEESLYELLANSIDAFVKKYFDLLPNQFADSCEMNHEHLNVFISLQFNAETLSLIYKDNAGGFSKEYLKNAQKLLTLKQTNESIEEAFPTEKCNDQSRFFGKCGKGMLTLFNLLLYGKASMDKGLEIPKFKNVEGRTSIHLQNNNETKGAEIILRSPLKPFKTITNPIINSTFQTKKRSRDEHELIDANTGTELKLGLPEKKRLRMEKGSLSSSFFSPFDCCNVPKGQEKKHEHSIHTPHGSDSSHSLARSCLTSLHYLSKA